MVSQVLPALGTPIRQGFCSQFQPILHCGPVWQGPPCSGDPRYGTGKAVIFITVGRISFLACSFFWPHNVYLKMITMCRSFACIYFGTPPPPIPPSTSPWGLLDLWQEFTMVYHSSKSFLSELAKGTAFFVSGHAHLRLFLTRAVLLFVGWLQHHAAKKKGPVSKPTTVLSNNRPLVK